MGRFYKTAKPEFIDDFTYQPPWEMMQQALQKEQGDYDLTIASNSILGNINYKYIDDTQEREKARLIQEEYANASDELTKKLKNSGNDWRTIIPEINNLKRKAEVDYKTGRIYEQQESAKNFEEHQKALAQELDPRMREGARKEAWYNFKNKGGVYHGVDTVKDPDIINEFFKVHKNYEPDKVATAYANLKKGNPNYIVDGKSATEYIKDYQNMFENFAAQDKFKPYLDKAHQYGIGTYKDEKGNYLKASDPRSTLYNGYNIAKDMNYSQTTKEAGMKDSNINLQNREFAFNKMKWAFENKKEEAPTANISKEGQFKTQAQLDKINEMNVAFNNNLRALGQKFGAKTKNINGEERYSMSNVREAIKNLPHKTKQEKAAVDAQLKKLDQIGTLYKSGFTTASMSNFRAVYGAKPAEDAAKHIQEVEKDPRNLYSKKGIFEVNGKTYKDITFYDLLKKLKPKTQYDSKGNEIESDATEQELKDYYVQNSSIPMLINDNPDDWRYNDMLTEYEVNGTPIKAQYSFNEYGLKPVR